MFYFAVSAADVFQLASEKCFQTPINDAEDQAFVPVLTARGFIKPQVSLVISLDKFAAWFRAVLRCRHLQSW